MEVGVLDCLVTKDAAATEKRSRTILIRVAKLGGYLTRDRNR
jgi:hypothetical protein